MKDSLIVPHQQHLLVKMQLLLLPAICFSLFRFSHLMIPSLCYRIAFKDPQNLDSVHPCGRRVDMLFGIADSSGNMQFAVACYPII
jgi:hypothetical protein